MRYIFAFIIAISMTGCAITWTTIGASLAAGIAVAEDVGGIVKTYKDTKESFMSDSNTTKD